MAVIERGGPGSEETELAYTGNERRNGITIRNGVALTITGAFLLQIAVMVFQFGRLTERLDQTIVALTELKGALRDTRTEVAELSRQNVQLSIRLQSIEQTMDRRR